MTTDFIDEVRTRSGRFSRRIGQLGTEEATKNALVLPFIQMLGYDIFDPEQVVPEFTADVGVKRHEKVDYALMSEGRPVMLIECKRYGVTLRAEMASQLLRYFTVTEAKFAILTDGIEYRFFTELDEPNVMDTRPFFEFNMLDFTEGQVRDLKRFTRLAFDEGATFAAARDLKYTREIKRAMAEEFASPSEDFLRFIIRRIHEPGARASSAARKSIRSLTQPALAQFMHDRINERLKTALEREEEMPAEPVEEQPPEPTQEEHRGLGIIRDIVEGMVDPELVLLSLSKHYTTVMLNGYGRPRVLCLLFLRTKTLRIQPGYGAPRLPVESVEGIRDHTDAIRARLGELLAPRDDADTEAKP